MGILTLLRNAFGRSRKPRATEPEGAPETPEQPPVPEPRESPTGEHDLVAAAFDKVKVPHQTPPAEQQTDEPEKAPEATAPTEPEPEAVTETGGEPEAATKTAADPDPEPKPTAEPDPEPKPTAEPAPEPEAAAPEPMTETAAGPEPELEPKAAAEPEPVTEAGAGSEPETVPGTEAEPAPQAEATAPAEPKPEPPTDAEGEAEATADTDPQAADGENAPQGPPAPDNETRTGGAGGNTDAEGEAEATAHTAPQEPGPRNETRTDAEGEAEAQSTPKPKPATPLTRVKSRTPALTTAYKAATTTLRKKNLTGTRAKLYLVLDRSASMRPYYKDGSAQSLADQTLALAAHLDPAPDPTVHVVFFSTEVDGTTDLTLAPGHDTKIDDAHAGLGRMGRTSYHAAVSAVLDHYDRHHDAHVDGDPVPALVVFQTDGAPDAKTPATQALTEAAETHPGVFFSFVAFGDHDNKAFDYLRRLKTPNASFFHAGPTPRELTDTELYEGVLADWRP
ncbi:VWA domain-containing protein [Streptomyces eurythermus]|uniref:VWA domain-containing protein n=1 Tax=Streptomyces eurythermus TaxID=42237 RepID=UPI0033FC74E3